VLEELIAITKDKIARGKICRDAEQIFFV